MSGVAASYKWWREQGHAWPAEIEHRYTRMPLYHIQESMLLTYMANCAPCRVLEFGCGFGRHLRYLHRVPGVELFGCDQSFSMVEGMRLWDTADWTREHVVVTDPAGGLPFADDAFDIVFTVSVLIHVPPDDLSAVLRELLRVSRWHVLHFEPAPDYPVLSDCHGGSWNHNIQSAYRRLGFQADILPQGYIAHAPYRIVVDPARELYTWPMAFLDGLRRVEEYIQQGFKQAEENLVHVRSELETMTADRESLREETRTWRQKYQAALTEAERLEREVDGASTETERLQRELNGASAEAERIQHELNGASAEVERLHREVTGASAEVESLRRESNGARAEAERLQRHLNAASTETEWLQGELHSIKSSYTWRFGHKIALSPMGRVALGLLRVCHRVRALRIRSPRVRARTRAKIGIRGEMRRARRPSGFSQEERDWLEYTCADKPPAIAVLHPEWRGIRSSTVNLFSAYRFVDDTVDQAKAVHLTGLLAETGCERVVLSGFPVSYRNLVRALRNSAPQIRVLVLWHGSFLQAHEEYAWQGFRIIHDLCRDGSIEKWGFVKKGLAEIVAAQTGIPTAFVMNYVGGIPEESSQPLPGGPHIGVFGLGSMWKLPYAVLAAASLIPKSKLHLSGSDARVSEFLDSLSIADADLNTQPIPQEEMPGVLAQMHLNVNLSLADCAPMLPLESLSVGAPCLISATSHLFEDHTYLRERLVVPYHERAEIIAEYALRAIAERDDIIAAYREYAPEYNARAKASVADFVGCDA